LFRLRRWKRIPVDVLIGLDYAAASKDKGEKMEDEKLRRWEGGTLIRQLIVMDQITYGMDSIIFFFF
jgi:hypothetical protein